MATFRANFSAAEKKEFGKRLRKLMADRGMTGADVARQATIHLPMGGTKHKPIGRDNISHYVNGRSVPNPVIMTAMGRALGTDLGLLLPRAHAQRKGDMPEDLEVSRERRDMSIRPDGTIDITIVMNLPREAGLQMMDLAVKHGRLPPQK